MSIAISFRLPPLTSNTLTAESVSWFTYRNLPFGCSWSRRGPEPAFRLTYGGSKGVIVRLAGIETIAVDAIQSELGDEREAAVLAEHHPVRARTRLARAERSAAVLIGVKAFSESAVGLDAVRGHGAAVVGHRHRHLAARIQNHLIRAVAASADFVEQVSEPLWWSMAKALTVSPTALSPVSQLAA